MAQINAVIITASDACSRGEREDKSGEALVELLTELGAHIVAPGVNVQALLSPLHRLHELKFLSRIFRERKARTRCDQYDNGSK